MRVTALERGPHDRVTGVALHDELHGVEHRARGALVVNASGPWVDEMLGEAGGARGGGRPR